jgi:hypothetical protein
MWTTNCLSVDNVDNYYEMVKIVGFAVDIPVDYVYNDCMFAKSGENLN